MSRAELRVGLDVGATHTDGVVVDARDQVLAHAKLPTTPDLRTTLEATGRDLIAQGIDPERVSRVMLSTNDVTDGALRRREVKRVAAIRIGGVVTQALPPLTTWPAGLRRAVDGGTVVVRGGAEYDGTVSAPLDRDAIARFLTSVADRAEAVALTAVFAPVAHDQELEAAELAREVLGPATRVSMSHELGSLGLLERENATILNAALAGAAEQLARVLFAALATSGIAAEPFFTQNDGTLMSLEHAIRFPMLMLGSGASSAIRGAAWLSGLDEGLVVDAGGRAIRIGALVNGAPRESTARALMAGVRVDFQLPELRRLPFGGDSLLTIRNGLVSIEPEIGPGLVFGGARPTLTDAVVAAGRSVPGARPLVSAMGDRLPSVLAQVTDLLADGVERLKAQQGALPLVVVGGAGALVPDTLEGVAEILRPSEGGLAGAIGAAIAPVSGRADRICANRPDERRRALEETRDDAFARAVHAGADPATLELVEVEEIPLTYLLDPAVRIRVKAAGPRG